MSNTVQLQSKLFVDLHGKGEVVVKVPVAQDGSYFHIGLRGPQGYRIGKKGEEWVVATFDEALAKLKKMSDPYWRRPSRTSGKPGIVRGVRWEMKPTTEVYSAGESK